MRRRCPTCDPYGSSPRRRGTRWSRPRARTRTDHPRAGGEHSQLPQGGGLMDGSSPRRRGTRPARSVSFSTPDHPRAGGEHFREDTLIQRASRIIPAQAGNTARRGRRHVHSRPDHPRAGGEHLIGSGGAIMLRTGSSPRRRGTQYRGGRCPGSTDGSSPRRRGTLMSAVAHRLG